MERVISDITLSKIKMFMSYLLAYQDISEKYSSWCHKSTNFENLFYDIYNFKKILCYSYSQKKKKKDFESVSLLT